MKTEKNILIAFILNLVFSLFELIGGLFTGSIAIVSDSVHDLGDAVSIGLSYFLERKSKKQPDSRYTYGYLRFSVLGGIITILILLFGSVAVIYGAISRLLNPVSINYNGMIVLSIIGAIVNFAAAYFTREGDSINQKAVNLHMLEDMLGWVVVLIGSIVMRFTDLAIIDPLMSIAVAVFILINAIKNLKETLDIFLEKIPENIDIDEIREHILEIDGVLDVHHIHIRTIDGHNNYATMHIVTSKEPHEIKHRVREELKEHNITHSTLELEGENERCHEQFCVIEHNHSHAHSHHHHHH
ncbi:MAG: cation transporter [Clostridia bacterium]|nr:cation transporter [Clostridia bacterium]